MKFSWSTKEEGQSGLSFIVLLSVAMLDGTKAIVPRAFPGLLRQETLIVAMGYYTTRGTMTDESIQMILSYRSAKLRYTP